MNEKITSQQLSEFLSKRHSFPRRVTDAFVRSFSDTIVEGLVKDGVVKVKGLGTFKLIEVERRESVNVNNGQRIIIPASRKLTFAPEDSLGVEVPASEQSAEPNTDGTPDEKLQGADEKLQGADEDFRGGEEELQGGEEEFQGSEEQVAEHQDDKSNAPEESVEEGQPVVTETPADEFGGIDVVIGTPESLQERNEKLKEARQNYDDATSRCALAAADVDAAQQQLYDAEAELTLRQSAVTEAENAVNDCRHSLETAQTAQTEAEQACAAAKEKLDQAQQQVDNMTNNVRTVLAAEECPEEKVEAEAPQPDGSDKDDDIAKDDNDTAKEDKENDTAEDAATETEVADTDEKGKEDDVETGSAEDVSQDEKPTKHVWGVLLAILLAMVIVGLVVFYVLCPPRHKKVKPQPVQSAVPVVVDSAAVKVAADSTARADSVAAAEAKHAAAIAAQAETEAASRQNETAARQGETAARQNGIASRQTESAARQTAASAAAERQKQRSANAAPTVRRRPSTYVLQPGETLTKVARTFYGSDDSVRAILRVNRFANPDVVPAGTVIKLP